MLSCYRARSPVLLGLLLYIVFCLDHPFEEPTEASRQNRLRTPWRYSTQSTVGHNLRDVGQTCISE